jgi:hypothetical protein
MLEALDELCHEYITISKIGVGRDLILMYGHPLMALDVPTEPSDVCCRGKSGRISDAAAI